MHANATYWTAVGHHQQHNIQTGLASFPFVLLRLGCLHLTYIKSQQELLLLHPFNGPLSRTTQVSWYQKGKTNLDFTEARDSEWQWHQPGNMQVCTSLQTDNYASTPPLSFFTGRMPFLPPNQQCQSTEGTKKSQQEMNAKNKYSHTHAVTYKTINILQNYSIQQT